MGSLNGAVIGFDPPRSQEPRRPVEDWGQWDEDNSGPQNYHDPDEAERCHLCDDTTLSETCDGCDVPLCPFHDRGQGGSGVHPTGEAHEEHEDA
jgi:hypothetical protein